MINLTPATEYEFEKRTRCSSGSYTSFSEPDYFTTSNCVAPAPVDVTFPELGKAIVEWTAQENAENYQIRYRQTGNSNWTVKSSTVPMKTLSNLALGKTYIYQLRAKCPSWTSWSSNNSFSTPNSIGETITTSRSKSVEFEIYPNPVQTGELYVSFDNSNFDQATLEIFDMNGRLVSKSSQVSNDKAIVVDHLNAGQYIAKLITKDSYKTSRFVIVN